jgi:hypothetical protein
MIGRAGYRCDGCGATGYLASDGIRAHRKPHHYDETPTIRAVVSGGNGLVERAPSLDEIDRRSAW